MQQRRHHTQRTCTSAEEQTHELDGEVRSGGEGSQEFALVFYDEPLQDPVSGSNGNGQNHHRELIHESTPLFEKNNYDQHQSVDVGGSGNHKLKSHNLRQHNSTADYQTLSNEARMHPTQRPSNTIMQSEQDRPRQSPRPFPKKEAVQPKLSIPKSLVRDQNTSSSHQRHADPVKDDKDKRKLFDSFEEPFEFSEQSSCAEPGRSYSQQWDQRLGHANNISNNGRDHLKLLEDSAMNTTQQTNQNAFAALSALHGGEKGEIHGDRPRQQLSFSESDMDKLSPTGARVGAFTVQQQPQTANQNLAAHGMTLRQDGLSQEQIFSRYHQQRDAAANMSRQPANFLRPALQRSSETSANSSKRNNKKDVSPSGSREHLNAQPSHQRNEPQQQEFTVSCSESDLQTDNSMISKGSRQNENSLILNSSRSSADSSARLQPKNRHSRNILDVRKRRGFEHPYANQPTPWDRFWYIAGDLTENTWLYIYEFITTLLEKAMSCFIFVILLPVGIVGLSFEYVRKLRCVKQCGGCRTCKARCRRLPRDPPMVPEGPKATSKRSPRQPAPDVLDKEFATEQESEREPARDRRSKSSSSSSSKKTRSGSQTSSFHRSVSVNSLNNE